MGLGNERPLRQTSRGIKSYDVIDRGYTHKAMAKSTVKETVFKLNDLGPKAIFYLRSTQEALRPESLWSLNVYLSQAQSALLANYPQRYRTQASGLE